MNEITGGLKNALERGDSLEKAKQSFINSGYKIDDVEQASQELFQLYPNLTSIKLPAISSFQTQQQLNQPQNTQQSQIQPAQSQYPPLPIQTPVKEGIAKKWIIIMIIFCLLVLIAAGIAGIYWDKLSTFLA